jgi:hypothetical protein
MCYACVDEAARWSRFPVIPALARPCEDEPDAEEVRTPTRAYLDERTQGTTAPTPERTPGTDIHALLERFVTGPTNTEVDEAERDLASQERLLRRLDEYHLRSRADRERVQYHEVPDPRQRHIVIARNRSEFVRYCNDHGLHVRRAIHVRTDDRMADRILMGLSHVAIHRVDGAMALERTEAYLRHLVASDRAMEAGASRAREVERDARNLITHGADGELRPAYRPRDYATPVQGRPSYHYVVDEAGHFWRDAVEAQAYQVRVNAFSQFYGSGPEDREPGEGYRPHGDIHTEPEDEDAMVAPFHWASTLQRSPYWYRNTGTLQTAAGAYKPEELDLDIRYV